MTLRCPIFKKIADNLILLYHGKKPFFLSLGRTEDLMELHMCRRACVAVLITAYRITSIDVADCELEN